VAVVGDGQARVVGHHVGVNGQNRSRVRFYPGDLRVTRGHSGNCRSLDDQRANYALRITTSIIFVTRTEASDGIPSSEISYMLAVFVSLYEREYVEIFRLSPAIAPFEKCTFNLARNAVK